MWVVADLDDDYIAKMEDVLEVYERPYDPQEPVVCLDEKPITLHADVRPASPAMPGREARRDNEYERCGTANVFCAVEPKAGRHFTFATPDRSGFEFAQVAVALAMAYPEAKTIHLVMDNLNIHRRKALADVFGAEMAAEVWDRFTVHYTPTHGSWLNQAEIEIGIFSRQCLGKRRIPESEDSAGRGQSLEPAHESGSSQDRTGSSTAKPLAGSSATNTNLSSGQRPSCAKRADHEGYPGGTYSVRVVRDPAETRHSALFSFWAAQSPFQQSEPPGNRHLEPTVIRARILGTDRHSLILGKIWSSILVRRRSGNRHEYSLLRQGDSSNHRSYGTRLPRTFCGRPRRQPYPHDAMVIVGLLSHRVFPVDPLVER